jgi:parallel beta helix pectate lyase-like protein
MRRALLTLVVFGVLAAPAQATDYVVNSTDDPVSPDLVCATTPGGCTLRDALDDAGAGDRVIVPANTYSLAQNGPLTPNGEQIVGAGARTTIFDAGGIPKVVEVANTAGGEISGVTLRNGGGQSQIGAGGAVQVRAATAAASLTLRNVTVSGSRAVAGGGVANLGGTMTIENSTITGNLASIASGSSGGGVVVAQAGTTTIRNSTISGNSAMDTDGSSAQGGGIFVEDGTLITQNVTIASNVANIATGLWVNDQTPTTITLTNTLIADTCFGAPFGGSRNLSTSTTCGFGAAVNPLLGPLFNNGGQTDTRALQVGSPAINAGATCPSTDQRGVAREGACDIGAYEYRTPVDSSPQGLPDPVFHKNVNALPKSGTVKIKLPGTDKFVTLTEGVQIPLGTTVDTRKGRVTIVAAAGTGQTADFYQGLFKVSQTKGAKPITVLTLVEKLTGCKTKKKASAAAKKKRKRRLWGNGSGRFRTKGKHSAATVVGTIWLVEDRCRSTLTRVRRGRVKVRDYGKKKTVTVRKGKKYIARAG